ncbi:MAG: hypothetical protein ABI831_10440 [Betaproteobacteria bacterium]
MNLAIVRKSLAALLVPVCAASAGLALAHTQNGSLGDFAGATDYYQISCSDDGNGVPASIAVQVMNRSPASPSLSVLVHRALSAVSGTDALAGDEVSSPLMFNNNGDGVYNVFVTKAAAGAENYTLTFHCLTGPDGTGEHTGTTLVFRQNQ